MSISKDKLIELKLKGHSCDDCVHKVCNKCYYNKYIVKSSPKKQLKELPIDKICNRWRYYYNNSYSIEVSNDIDIYNWKRIVV